jgi:hypothetical protein
MRCPDCDLSLPSSRWLSANTYVCPVCHGIWTVAEGECIRVGTTAASGTFDTAQSPVAPITLEEDAGPADPSVALVTAAPPAVSPAL